MNPVSIGLDLGTSGLKVIAVTAQGERVAEASANYPLLTPKPGWTEQNPQDWVEATRKALSELALALRGRYEPVALGLSGQMHGATFLDAQGQVIRPAPLWNDQRTGEACAEIERAIPRGELIQRTGNPAVTGFQLPKLVWLRRAEPEHFARVAQVLLPKDYLGFALTGHMATEPSDASGVGALNLAARAWDHDILSALDLRAGMFPEVLPSHAVSGRLSPEWAKATGLPEGLPVVAGAGDNAGAAIGLGLSQTRPGLGSLSLGTSGVLFVPLETPTPEPEGRIHLFCHADGGYHLLGVTLAAAGSLQWYRDKLAPGVPFDELMGEAEAVSVGSDGLVFMPYLAGERSPYLDPDLRGSWLGLSLAHGRGHLTRSLLEGVALSLRDVLEVMRPLVRLERLLAIGGGARSELWLSIVASALRLPLARTEIEEGPARGAAVLGLVGAGVYASVAEALEATAPQQTELQHHRLEMETVYARYKQGFAAVTLFKD
ncbi:xylulokinase [Meiothermus granaticius]|uniref:Xylulose kinase n=1 Tax=Meiothermus granaticius NBRC 107808 TaxID=1227551 RepID=A0A399F714_9DEIN|nr:xylulokinase [Meiothermus granaticius]RIH91059.1 Xylulose kinase [Meiothermus granaticius NBRC 107808]GEM86515.1 xylulokinase [Meiothermus granaticius NBRC 107808]